jgi:hypothetical protein
MVMERLSTWTISAICTGQSRKWMCMQQFKAQRGRPRGDLPALIHRLGLEQSVLNQPWTQLSVQPVEQVQSHVVYHQCEASTIMKLVSRRMIHQT